MPRLLDAILRRLPKNILFRAYQRWTLLEYRRKVALLEERFSFAAPNDAPLVYLETAATIKASLTMQPHGLIDVGASKGYFARAYAALFRPKNIVLFEPIKEYAEHLRSVRFGPISVVVQKAVSSSSSIGRQFFLHPDPVMSSLAKVDSSALDEKFPGDPSEDIRTVLVDCVTLDSAPEVADLVANDGPLFLKIDVQGHELEVLQGARSVLEKTVGILIEYMFCTPYINQAPWEDLVGFITSCGFKCRAVMNATRRPNYEISGVDFLFERHV